MAWVRSHRAGALEEPAPPDGEARCSTCREVKPIDQFSPNRSRPRGVQASCKDCWANRMRRARGVDMATIPSKPDRCDACSGDGGARGLVLDHDHETGRARGWICHPCNLTAGNVGDDPERLEALARYLRGA